MKIERTRVPGVVVIEPDVFSDDRGYFAETLGSYHNFIPVQTNQSKSKKGVIRGMHYQKGTAKLVWVARGSIYDVALNPVTKEWVGRKLTADNHEQLYVPADFAHGFQALEDDTIVCYAMDHFYSAKDEGGYNPLTCGFDWPIKEAILSDKDKNALNFHS